MSAVPVTGKPTLVALPLPDRLHYQLQQRRRDAVAVALSRRPGLQCVAAVEGTHLVEHGLDELVLDHYMIGNARLAVVHLERFPDRLLRRRAIEIVDMEVVAVNVGDSSLEEIAEPRVRVLADRDQEVGAQVGPVDAVGELIREPLGHGLLGAVEEVLLELVEHDEQARVHRARRRPDRRV